MTDLAPAPAAPQAAELESVELVLNLIELLARSRGGRGVTDVARTLGISKARAHRHLRALVSRGYATQDLTGAGYEIGIRLLSLGEQVRDRFDVVTAIRPSLAPLRAATGLGVTASAVVADEVVVLEMMQGATLIETGVRAGSRLDFHASAHGLVALAFGPAGLLTQALSRPLTAWTVHTLVDPAALRAEVGRVRARGWATAPDAVQLGVNALAAPVRDHRGVCRGAVALVGATQFIAATPTAEQIAHVAGAARESSRRLGWEGE
ncbi:MAG TPA: IclR family transcriptional regulator [Caulobacteraceae bacterium]|jgi:DNA-binding IclR family transcriptional regulator|nr:IclR family transcriptional regulator [Caulobacteraceae bacterium]